MESFPLAWFVEEVKYLPEKDQLGTIHNSKFPDGAEFDPAKTALIEGQSSIINGKYTIGAVRDISVYGSGRIRIKTNTANPGFLVVGNIYYPGWSAYIDNKDNRTELYRVNYLQSGLVVPAGEHEVNLVFKPLSFKTGLVISSVSVLLLVIILFYGRYI